MEKIEIEKNKAELEFEKSLELRNFEIDKFWQRGWFFGALLGGIIGGYYEVYKDHREFCIYLSFLALLVSCAQCLMNRGSKYWQERWEYHAKHKESILGIDITKTDNIFPDDTVSSISGIRSTENFCEKDLIEAYILAKEENALVRGARFSVSKLAILVWDIISIFLFFLWIHDLFNCFISYWYGWDYGHLFIALIVHVVIIGYIYVFCDNKNIYEELGKNLAPSPKSDNNKTKKVISRQDLQNIYPAGKLDEL